MKKYLFPFAAAILMLAACNDDENENTVNPNQEKTPTEVVAVDLGLPSGTKWANMNVGATKVTGFGTYFAWGEIKGYTVTTETNGDEGAVYTKDKFSWETYGWCKGNTSTFTKYCPTANADQWEASANGGEPDGKTQLEIADDAARAVWGGAWRMPTKAEADELLAQTNSEWVTNFEGTGVDGYKFTNKSDATKFIFMPAAGCLGKDGYYGKGTGGGYWTSTLTPDDPRNAYDIYFGVDYLGVDGYYRFYGQSVRAVQ